MAAARAVAFCVVLYCILGKHKLLASEHCKHYQYSSLILGLWPSHPSTWGFLQQPAKTLEGTPLWYTLSVWWERWCVPYKWEAASTACLGNSYWNNGLVIRTSMNTADSAGFSLCRVPTVLSMGSTQQLLLSSWTSHEQQLYTAFILHTVQTQSAGQ